MRARFEEHKNEKDMVKATQLLRAAEEEFWHNQHPQPYIFPESPGGTSYERYECYKVGKHCTGDHLPRGTFSCPKPQPPDPLAFLGAAGQISWPASCKYISVFWGLFFLSQVTLRLIFLNSAPGSYSVFLAKQSAKLLGI